ncbi:tetratricopeptide repeat protein [Ulvibacterium sp.]|uniref:tetratricopeptide repeat protein n=1 Tax=Ulvibacterium sp. TaxID=2665914 RepID=UPI003BA84381
MARILFLIGVLISVSGYPQSKIDSLEKRLDREKVDSLKVKLLLDLFDEYQYENPAKAETSIQKALGIATGIRDKRYEVMTLNAFADLLNGRAQNDSAISVFQRALALAEDITYDSGKGIALLGLGNTYLSKGDLIQAEAYHQRNIAFAKQVDDFEGLASSHNNLGNIYNETGEYKKAMEAYTYAAKMNTEIGNEKNAGINFANIGLINQKLTNYNKALDYYAKSDSLFKKFDFLPGRAFVLKNMGVVYRNQKKPDAALEKYHQALESYKQMDLKREMSQVYENIGNIYSDKSQSKEAIYNYHRSLSIATQTSDSINMAIFSQSLGQEFFNSKKWDSAGYYSKRALQMAKAVGADLTTMDGYKVLAQVYRAKSDHEKAFTALMEYQILRDSLYTLEKRDLAEEIEAQYQNEEKTKEIALLASEKELQALQLSKRKNERNGTIAFSVFILVFAVLLYNQYRIKQRANKELQELGRLKSNFFANISHEFRTPLTLIKGSIEHLEQNPEEQLGRNDVKMIRRNTNKVLGLVNQLLDLSRIDEGKLQLKSTEGDIFKCLRTAAASFNSYAAQRNMDYRVEIPSETLWAAFDRDKLEKVVYNLLSNAFKFSEDGELVALKASYTNADLVIQISDSGRGISEDKLPFIFDRFYQVDGGTTKDREGSGIGLSLSKDLVELMDGTITVSSEEGKGTYFTVQIPMERIKTPRASVEVEILEEIKETPIAETFDLPKSDVRDLPAILLVEDNEDMLHFIKTRLVETYRIIEARNGEEGIKMAMAHLPDLLITDLMMPKMDGMELCKKLKTNLETSHIPVIMLTARAGVENKIEGLETGADDYLTKPFDAKELAVRVKNLIDQRQRLRAHYRDNAYTVHPEKITTTSLDRKFLEQVLDLLEKKYTDANFGVPQMQRALAMSKTQLHRKIKALTNESPGELLRNFRLKRAAQLLSQKADTVTQIAYQVGFNNLSYFAKCFKALYGVAPSSY